MKKRLGCLFLMACLLFASCSPKEKSPSPPLPIREEGYDAQTASRYFIEQRDEKQEGEVTKQDSARLWYLTNALYNADDTVFVEECTPPEGSHFAGSAGKFLDFEEATRYLFTSRGREQLLSVQIGGAPYFYKAEDGAIYHLGPWKTGYSYEKAMTGCRIISGSKDKAQVEVSYRVMGPMEWEGEYPEAFATMFLQKEDGHWKVDSYNFPEGVYPEEFTVTEEVRIQLAAGDEETALSDAAQKEKVICWLEGLMEGEYVKEAPPQENITVEAVDNGRVYDVSFGPDGRVWDNLWADGEWLQYRLDPQIYQELQGLFGTK